ncbi:MAG: S9 family peptidase [Crocinitomicaceae bacterium]|nr:S9 family peptidase [Crocinitomicaceae bacterium]
MFQKITRIVLSTIFLSSFISLGQNVLTPEILLNLKRLSGGKVSQDGKKVLFEMNQIDVQNNRGNVDLYVYDLASDKYTQITKTPFSEMEANWGKNNEIWFLTTEKETVQVFKMNADGSDKKQITSPELKDIDGYKLSPSQNKIVLIRSVKTSQTLADKYPELKKANARIEDDLMYRHWSSWSDENSKQLFLYDIKENSVSGAGINILENEKYNGVLPPFGGSEGIVFSSNGDKIMYSCKKKIGKEFALSTNSEIYEYTIATKETKTLTTGYNGYDKHPVITKSGKSLAWLSMARDGYEADKNNIIFRDLATGKDRNLTAKHDITVDEFMVSPDEKTIYFIAPAKGTSQIFSLDIKTGNIKQLTSGQFDFVSIEYAPNQLIAARQSMIAPTDLYSIDLKTNKIKQLTAVNEAILSKLTLPTVKEEWIKTSDGKDMLVWMVYPPNFNANKKYPTLLYCQGGPQSMVSQFFSYRWNLALMASNDYIVVAPNRRGLPGFGQKWNEDISKDWGGQSIRDYLSATDFAKTLPYVDGDKMGAVGASYGGYSVYFLAGNHEGRFKTFISHCGLFNLESWYGTTEELFFANWDNYGPYWLPENKEYYEKNSPHKFVQNWDTPILVIHGGMDFRVPEAEGMQAFQAAQLKGLKSKYLYFPTESHWVSSPQNSLIWQNEFFEWLAGDLK